MSKIEPRLFDELKKVLVSFGDKYFIGDELNRSKVSDDLRAYDEALLAKLFEIDFIKKNYIKEVAGQKLFQIDQLEEAILYDDYWDTSYTKYENRVGLTSNGRFIEDSQDVVLDFPFKDNVLTASMTKEDSANGYDDAFLNEVIEKDEIDRLFDKKILNNEKRYDVDGEKDTDNFDVEKDNLIIKGNNLIALHTLRKLYSGKVKFIYLDPPYNTGEDSWNYNDSFSHSAWLTFMKNRLEIAKELLTDDGVIIINTDEVEQAYLKVLSDAIFGRENFVGDLIWKKRKGGGNDSRFIALDHDYLAVYTKSIKTVGLGEKWRVSYEDEYLKRYKYSDDKSGLRYYWDTLARDGLKNPIPVSVVAPDGTVVKLNSQSSQATVEKELREGNIKFTHTNNGWKLHHKVFQPTGKVLRSILNIEIEDVPTNKNASDEIKLLFGDATFNTPKPEGLLKKLIELVTNEGDMVLDFFMGSATTQAVAMKMNRRFIGIEQMEYINTVSVPRLQKVIAGEQGGISKDVNWQGGGSFVYAELMQKNMGYLQDIISSKTIGELHEVYNRMLSGVDGSQATADISFKADLDKIEWDTTKVKFDDQKRLLIKLLDKNGLYYNYSEIDDENVREFLSDRDYQFNQSFYEAGE
ncbi:DNA methyltransferase [Liquorilactobacillus nagelii]|uniref:Type III restriction endonuclease subunit M n=2 Tax=Lactobacillaceae TaxID=33958 RepID=A0A3S6QTR0_9LACO|nr:DNA methyltransferase [Liquorilactobacillus nagelii]AUJ31350.1 type III restriction endonuclease subunit M [Liquorilactobacillus nagelii]MCC7616839.1 type III restriction endonuclease subunit M [Liquorilactobacillus nagelii]MCP9315569.1 site-specific DNA-methyltransferase [Liquorilactobacillus nagelii]